MGQFMSEEAWVWTRKAGGIPPSQTISLWQQVLQKTQNSSWLWHGALRLPRAETSPEVSARGGRGGLSAGRQSSYSHTHAHPVSGVQPVAPAQEKQFVRFSSWWTHCETCLCDYARKKNLEEWEWFFFVAIYYLAWIIPKLVWYVNAKFIVHKYHCWLKLSGHAVW